MQYEVILHPVALIRPSEEVNMEHVIALTEDIARCQKWITPVPIEKHTGIIMDGNHRYRVANNLGLMYLPCILLDYTDVRVRVHDWNNGEPFCPLKIRDHIVNQGKIFPYKTTRHLFSPVLPAVDFQLKQLFGIRSLTI
ncbi:MULTISPECIES: ParB N-terminal domain-containing protein [Serratia]|uniref:ParB N-terminal domain-containing protein n=1 Tax=Serratia TaxID=613 RepID=UPI00094B2E2C|nr:MULTISPECIES: ParB N-terminal domain-containing protein [Serratia]MBH3191606.1 ParB N-terminal domain-containing protein [Serratia marcescens]NMQ39903.1 ParB N-terminal domain-containing protein [Serratia marcescens]